MQPACNTGSSKELVF